MVGARLRGEVNRQFFNRFYIGFFNLLVVVELDA